MATNNFLPAAQQAGGALPEKACFDEKLNVIRKQCTKSNVQKYKAREQEMRALVGLYLWYAAVLAVTGLWHAYAAQFERQRKPRKYVASGINFAHLIQLGYANYLAIDDNFVSRKNAKLNLIDREYKSNPELYQHDAEEKLVSFMMANKVPKKSTISSETVTDEVKAGVDKSTEQINNIVAGATSMQVTANGKPRKFAITNAQRQTHLPPKAESYFAEMREGNAIASNYPLVPSKVRPLNQAGTPYYDAPFVTALIAQTPNGAFVISAEEANSAIDEAKIFAYRKSYAALHNSVRVPFETIRTQMLQLNLTKHEEFLSSGEKIKSQYRTGFVRKQQRLVYRADMGDFLLSQAAAKTSVVTIAKPKNLVIEAADADSIMLRRTIERVEVNLLRHYDMHMYTPTALEKIPALEMSDFYSHLVDMKCMANPAEQFPLHFLKLAPETSGKSTVVDIDMSEVAKGSCFVMTAAELKVINNVLVQHWLNTCGDNINRPKHFTCEMEFQAGEVIFGYEFSGVFNEHMSFPVHSTGAMGINYKAIFKSHELFSAINGIAALDIDGDINVTVNDDGVYFKFENSAAHYTVGVPVHSAEDKQVNKTFIEYMPTTSEPQEPEQTELDDLQLVLSQLDMEAELGANMCAALTEVNTNV